MVGMFVLCVVFNLCTNSYVEKTYGAEVFCSCPNLYSGKAVKYKLTSVKNPLKQMLYWSIYMIVTFYAYLISMASFSENQ
jgi:hypothetical protein